MVRDHLSYLTDGPLSSDLRLGPPPGQRVTQCHLPLPAYILANEKHSKCLTERVYLPAIVSGRVIWRT
jgi:hypothetical protein